ncbi:MAG TPA: aldehyde dehydrogenase family protein, partial [Chloroflexota bacterium]|nr:aldehyde dehydrogenase family protein [Chloroflexota bacterium]
MSRAQPILDAFEPFTSGVAYDGRFVPARGQVLESVDPTTGEVLARVPSAAAEDYDATACATLEAFARWRSVPAPRRGEVVRRLGDALRARKQQLACLVSLENGKIVSEALGEVQEVIDMCDFAVGLSRQLYGREMQSERPQHRLVEQWHPLGVVGIISAFNFPVAVPGWGWALAFACGDTVLWKPSELTPLVSIAVLQIVHDVTRGTEAEGVFSLVVGPGPTVGERLVADPRVPLVQATGSCRMGRRVAEVVGKRTGRAILELGGNNA